MELVSCLPSGFLNFKMVHFHCVLTSGYGPCCVYGYDVEELIAGFCWGNLKGSPGVPGRREEDKIKMDLREIGWGQRQDLSGSE